MLVVNFPVTVLKLIIPTLLAPSFQSHRKSIAQVCVWGGEGANVLLGKFCLPRSLTTSQFRILYIRLSFYRWKFPSSFRVCLLSIMIRQDDGNMPDEYVTAFYIGPITAIGPPTQAAMAMAGTSTDTMETTEAETTEAETTEAETTEAETAEADTRLQQQSLWHGSRDYGTAAETTAAETMERPQRLRQQRLRRQRLRQQRLWHGSRETAAAETMAAETMAPETAVNTTRHRLLTVAHMFDYDINAKTLEFITSSNEIYVINVNGVYQKCHPSYDSFKTETHVLDTKNDLCVLHVHPNGKRSESKEDCSINELTPLKLMADASFDRSTVFRVIGYPLTGEFGGKMTEVRGKVLAVHYKESIIEIDNDSRCGMSGGPWMIEGRENDYVYGIQSGNILPAAGVNHHSFINSCWTLF